LVTGNPIRPAIAALAAEERKAPHSENRPLHLLVTGGSLGATFLNQRVPDLLQKVVDRGLSLEVRHQVGGFAVEHVRAAYARAKIAAVVSSYIDDMVEAYRWADLAIARAGAGTIAELAVSGLPALLVPLPNAPGNHQVANARAFTAIGGGWSVEEKDWRAEAPIDRLTNILRDETVWTAASRRARQFATPHATRTIVADCEALLSRQFSGS
jgi:UDP-N-acetylglucosamine--N-acetylmuramyl-(pentapeptide) pyrophosphoryl-undecaprenol N-acetylglucosamine transferase